MMRDDHDFREIVMAFDRQLQNFSKLTPRSEKADVIFEKEPTWSLT